MSDDATTPAGALNAYVRASAAHDLEATMFWISEDALYWFSNESCHAGRQAVREAIGKNFEVIRDGAYGIDRVQWIVKERDVAVCAYEYRWSGTIGGERMSGGGRGTNVLRRTGEGWRIVHEHLSRGSSGTVSDTHAESE